MKRMSNALASAASSLSSAVEIEAPGAQRRVVDARRLAERGVADGVGLDLADRRFVIAERAQSLGDRAVDDLEIAAARQLLELHQREIGLDAGGVAIHHQADRAGRSDHRHLRVAIAMPLAAIERLAPQPARRRRQAGPGGARLVERGVVERRRRHRQRVIAGGLAVGGERVVADDAQHRGGVALVLGERAELGRHFGRGGVGAAGHDRRKRAADRPPLVAVIGNAAGHQQPADIGVAEAERAEVVGVARDLLGRELRHRHRDFEREGPQPHGVLVGRDVEHAGLRIAELQQVQRSQVARGVVEEHVFRAWIARADAARGRAGVPVVDRRVELQAGIGGGPGGVADLLPQFARLQRLVDLAVEPARQVPVAVVGHRAQEIVGDAHGVVGILSADGEIGFRIPVGIVGLEFEIVFGIALARELDDPVDHAVRHVGAARQLHLALQRGILVDLEAIVTRALAVDAGLKDRLEMALDDFRAGDQRRDLLLLPDLPVDERLDVGMVGVDDHHLRRAARRAAGFDRARRTVADLQERHQAAGASAARQLLVRAAQRREIRARPRTVFEQARLAHPQVHDAAVVDEIVGDRLDEAGVRLRMLVGRLRPGQLARLEVDVIVTLAGTVDAIGPMKAGVEPLRRIGRGHLARQHEAHFVEERARVFFGVEIAALPAPIGPGAGEPVEHLLGGGLRTGALALGQRFERRLVGDRAPQERRHGVLLDALQPRRDPRLAEILLGEHVGRHLAPAGGDLDVVEREDDRAVGVADLASGRMKFDQRVGRNISLGVSPLDPHFFVPRFADASPPQPRRGPPF